MRITATGFALLCAVALPWQQALAASCDKGCLEEIASSYRAAYRAHDVKLAPFAARVRFTENNVEMAFPDGTWDTVTMEVDRPLVVSDPSTGQVGIYTSIMQRNAQGFLAVRLRVRGRRITEVEHVISTLRNVSGPPVPIGDVWKYHRSPAIGAVVPVEARVSRAELMQQADGYFSTLQYNTGEVHARFGADAVRHENGMFFGEIEQGFRSGRYRYNNRVRDRDCFLVDEERAFVMCRGFIDHKGVLDEYTFTDGRPAKSNYQEPHSWGFLEGFKVTKEGIVAVEATFSAVPYFMRSPWTRKPDAVYDAARSTVRLPAVPAAGPASR